MNNKGFTIIEIIISFSILTVILLSLITFTITYRDKVREEEMAMMLLDYKNTMTKLLYDDIIDGKYKAIEKCSGQGDTNITCVNFIDRKNVPHPLRINTVTTATADLKTGMYLNYEGINYLLPDSDIYNSKEGLRMCAFDSFVLTKYNNVIYNLRLSYHHRSLDLNYEIMLTIN